MRWLQIGWRLNRIVPVAAIAAALVLGACSGVEAPPVPEGADAQLVEGRDLWRRNCTRCHGGDGGGGAGPSLKGPWTADRQPDEALMLATVTEGRGAMPRFGSSLSDDEIEAVVRYVREVL